MAWPLPSLVTFVLAPWRTAAIPMEAAGRQDLLIESLGPWSAMMPIKKTSQSDCLVYSEATGRLGLLERSSGLMKWVRDIGSLSIIESRSDEGKGQRKSDLEGWEVVDDFVKLQTVLHPLDEKPETKVSKLHTLDLLDGSLRTSYLLDEDVDALDTPDRLMAEFDIREDGRVLGTGWMRDESLAEVVASSPIFKTELNLEDYPEPLDSLLLSSSSRSIQLAPLYKDIMAIDTSTTNLGQPVLSTRSEGKCSEEEMMTLGASGRISRLCVGDKHDDLLIQASYTLPESICPSGRVTAPPASPAFWHLSSSRFLMHFVCEMDPNASASSKEERLIEIKLTEDNQALINEGPVIPQTTHWTVESNGKYLFLVNQEAIGDEDAVTPIAALSPYVRHVLQADEVDTMSLYLVKETPSAGGINVQGYHYQFPSRADTPTVISHFTTRLAHQTLVTRIGDEESKTAMAQGFPGGRYSYPSIIIKQDGSTISKYPTEVLTFYLTQDQITERLTLTAINALSGAKAASYLLPEGAELNDSIAVLRSDNAIFVHYRSKLPASINPNHDIALNERLHQLDVVEFVSDVVHDPWDLLLKGFGLASQTTSQSTLAQDLPTPLLIAKTYILPGEIERWTFTQSEQGILPRHLLVKMKGAGLLSIPSNVLSARRPIVKPGGKPDDGEMEEGLRPYDPVPLRGPGFQLAAPFQYRGQKFVTASELLNFTCYPSMGHESATNFLISSKGLFGMATLNPAGKFDTLPSDNDISQVALAIMVLVATIVGAHVYKKHSAFKKKWK